MRINGGQVLVKKLIVVPAGVLAGFAAATAMFGTGVAAADDVVGQTYDDATTALSDEGKEGKVATVVGDKQDRGSCVVTSAVDAPFVGGADGAHVEDTVLLNLNCYATSASSTPGYSAANQAPDAQAVRDAEAEAEAESEAGVTSENER
jgi:hypothetical protein